MDADCHVVLFEIYHWYCGLVAPQILVNFDVTKAITWINFDKS